jgi:hypothetical protein
MTVMNEPVDSSVLTMGLVEYDDSSSDESSPDRQDEPVAPPLPLQGPGRTCHRVDILLVCTVEPSAHKKPSAPSAPPDPKLAESALESGAYCAEVRVWIVCACTPFSRNPLALALIYAHRKAPKD